jgi:uncharacterized membrane protein
MLQTLIVETGGNSFLKKFQRFLLYCEDLFVLKCNLFVLRDEICCHKQG